MRRGAWSGRRAGGGTRTVAIRRQTVASDREEMDAAVMEKCQNKANLLVTSVSIRLTRVRASASCILTNTSVNSPSRAFRSAISAILI